VSLAQSAIAHLMDLAEQGEIDPWNVQVIEVIDRFLSTLTPDATQAVREVELSQSGQAFLYASMLLLLKADTLVRLETLEPTEDESILEEPDADAAAWATQIALPLSLERRLRRRTTVQHLQRRGVTLPELIEQLQRMAEVLESTPVTRPRPRRPRPHSRAQAVQQITQLAHHENLSELASDIEQLLLTYDQETQENEGWMDFNQLLSLWPKADRVGGFWALLFLSAQSKVEIAQATFYEDLRVRLLPPALLEENSSPAA
jgi:segregation and condensation protein A